MASSIQLLLDRPHPLYLAGETVTGSIQWKEEKNDTNGNHSQGKEEEETTHATTPFFCVTFSGSVECGWTADTTTPAVIPNDETDHSSDRQKHHSQSYYSSCQLLLYVQHPTDALFATSPQAIVRGVIVVEMDVRYNTTPTASTNKNGTNDDDDDDKEHSFWVFQVLWWPHGQRHNKNDSSSPIYLGQTIVGVKETTLNDETNDVVSSHLITPCIHSDDNNMPPKVQSIQLSLSRFATTIHSVTLQTPFLKGGSLQVTRHLSASSSSNSNNNNKSQLHSRTNCTTFSFSIPRTAPSSFGAASPPARIRYGIMVVSTNNKNNDNDNWQVHEQEIWVIPQWPSLVSSNSTLWRPTWTSRQVCPVKTNARHFWFTSNSTQENESIACQLGFLKRIYAPGDVLQFTSQTHVRNETNDHDVQITLRLIRTMTCTILDGYVRRQVTCKTYPIGTQQKRRFSRLLYPQETWEPATLDNDDNNDNNTFVIPSVPPSTIHGTTEEVPLPVQVSYTLQLHVSAVDSNETMGHAELPVLIGALPPPVPLHLIIDNDQGVEWDPHETWEDSRCFKLVPEDDSRHMPELCVLPTTNSMLWDVTMNGQSGVYSPHQHVLTLFDSDDVEDDDEQPVEENLSLLQETEIVRLQRTTVPEEESISDPDDEEEDCSQRSLSKQDECK